MLQQPEPDDYVLATGESHSVREFIEVAFREVGRDIVWRGRGAEEVGIDANTGEDLVRVDPGYFRPTEIDELLGDASKAAQRLGWHHKISFQQLVSEMVQSDLNVIANESWRKDFGTY